MKVETLVNMLLEVGQDGHALFPTETLRNIPAEFDLETMADMADAGLEHRIENLNPNGKDSAKKAELAKMLYHLRDDAEFRAEVGRLMLREYRKETSRLTLGDAAEIE
jgi:hypothetical protein